MSAVREEPIDLLVVARKDASLGVAVFDLQEVNGRALPEWTAGAHIDLLVSDQLVRQYSLCGDPADRSLWRVGVLLDPAGSGGSVYIHEKLNVGSKIRALGPRNHFILTPSPQYLFVAGGIGITPILPMLRAAQATRADWKLVYGGRTRDSMAFLDELASYGDRVCVWPQDETGLIELAAFLGPPREDILVYCCGPEPLLAAMEICCAIWPAGALRLERFAAKPLEASLNSMEFEVHLQRSGLTLTVRPDQSIIDVVQAAGIEIVCSCRGGTCGSCETTVMEGSPDHRDSVLSEDERTESRSMMICVSRSLSSRLVLDL